MAVGRWLLEFDPCLPFFSVLVFFEADLADPAAAVSSLKSLMNSHTISPFESTSSSSPIIP